MYEQTINPTGVTVNPIRFDLNKIHNEGYTMAIARTTCGEMEFPKKLRKLMADHRYSQETLARLLDVSQNLVSLWCRGKNVPDLQEAAKIARTFGVSLDYLADDSLDDEPAPAISEDEAYLLRVIRDSGFSIEFAVKSITRGVLAASQLPGSTETGAAFVAQLKPRTYTEEEAKALAELEQRRAEREAAVRGRPPTAMIPVAVRDETEMHKRMLDEARGKKPKGKGPKGGK